jgi:hypothetical protein
VPVVQYFLLAIRNVKAACALYAAMLSLVCAAGCGTESSSLHGNQTNNSLQPGDDSASVSSRQIQEGSKEHVPTAPLATAPPAVGGGDTEGLAASLAVLKGRVEARVDLSFTAVTDDDLAALDFPDSVHEIDLSSTEITDRGVESLLRVPNLQTLVLIDTRVTEGVAEILKRMPSLCEVRLDNTNVSPDTQMKLIQYFAPRASARAERKGR